MCYFCEVVYGLDLLDELVSVLQVVASHQVFLELGQLRGCVLELPVEVLDEVVESWSAKLTFGLALFNRAALRTRLRGIFDARHAREALFSYLSLLQTRLFEVAQDVLGIELLRLPLSVLRPITSLVHLPPFAQRSFSDAVDGRCVLVERDVRMLVGVVRVARGSLMVARDKTTVSGFVRDACFLSGLPYFLQPAEKVGVRSEPSDWSLRIEFRLTRGFRLSSIVCLGLEEGLVFGFRGGPVLPDVLLSLRRGSAVLLFDADELARGTAGQLPVGSLGPVRLLCLLLLVARLFLDPRLAGQSHVLACVAWVS